MAQGADEGYVSGLKWTLRVTQSSEAPHLIPRENLGIILLITFSEAPEGDSGTLQLPTDNCVLSK